MYGLRWLIKQNIPVLTRGNSGSWRLKRESWLAGQYERTIVDRLITESFKVDLELREKLLVFHRVPAWPGVEYVVEVFGEGARLGLLVFDAMGQWRLIPSGALTSIIVESGGIHVSIGELEKRYLKNKKLRLESDLCRDKTEYILISTSSHSGVAKVLSSAECTVKIKDMAPSGLRPLRKPTIEELVKYNQETITYASMEAKKFIREVYERYVAPGEIYVSFSGGADSTAVLSLAVEELGASKVKAVSCDTGLEFPENKEYIERVASTLGVELIVLRPKSSFIDEIEKRGLMSARRRWCTDLFKLTPLREYYYSRGVKVYLDGARDYESTLRARTPRLGENPAIKGVLRALPIKNWPRILVQLYLLSRGIELNPLYDQGFARLGCLVCPAMHRYELILSYERYPWIHQEILRRTRVSVEEYLSLKWSERRVFNTSS